MTFEQWKKTGRAFIEDKHQKWEPPMAVAWGTGWIVGGWCSS